MFEELKKSAYTKPAVIFIFMLALVIGSYLYLNSSQSQPFPPIPNDTQTQLPIQGMMYISSPCTVTLVNQSIKSLSLQQDIQGQSSYSSSGSIGGSFVLGFGGVYGDSYAQGSGSIGNVMNYYYYAIQPDGSYKLDSIPASSTTIYEDTNGSAYIESLQINDTRVQVDEGEPIPNEGLTQDQVDQTYCMLSQEYVTTISGTIITSGQYLLHVPNGTIQQQYNAGG